MTSDPKTPGADLDTSPTVGGRRRCAGNGFQLRTGAVFGRYTVLQRLGEGGMGVVYAAYDPDLDRKIALKLLLPELRGGLSQQRLLREAQAMARLSHPHVVTVHDVGQVDGRTFIAMEFVDGQSLDRWLAEAPRETAEILAVFLQAGQGLAAAHRAGLVHRDFKPSNVLLGTDGRARVADFGLARGLDADDEAEAVFNTTDTVEGPVDEPPKPSGGQTPLAGPLTEPGTIVGTPRSMAPEQVLERKADAASDQFSFCLALFEALCGEPAFGTGDMMQLARRALAGEMAPVPSGIALSARAKRALIRGLSADPGNRFPSMEALLGELSFDPSVTRRRRLGFAVGLVAAVAAAVVATQMFSARRQLCSGGASRAAAVWNDARSDRLREAFGGTGLPFAASAAHSVALLMTDRCSRWSAAYREACEATRLRGETSEGLLDRQMACLDQRLMEMDRLLDLFEHADPDLVEGAAESLTGLRDPEPCLQVAEMAGLQALPSDRDAVAAIKAVRNNLAQAEALKVTGRFDEALERLEPLIDQAESVDYAPLTADMYCLKGHIEIELGLGDEADATLRQALVAAERAGADRVFVTAANELVWAKGILLQQFDRAAFWSDLAEARAASLAGESLETEVLSYRSALLEQSGRFDEALTLQTRVYDLIVEATGPTSIEANYAHSQLANAYHSIGDFETALEHYRQVARLRQELLGPDHPHLAMTFSSMGSCLGQLQRYDEALSILERALAITEASYGDHNPSIATILNNIAYTLEALGRVREALEMYNRALSIIQNHWGPDHIQTAYAHLNRVSIFRKLGRLETGLAEARTAERIIEQSLGADHPLYAFGANAEGVMLLLLNRPSEAIRPLEAALAIRQGVTTDPLVVAQTQFSLAKALWTGGIDRSRARTLIERSRTAFRDIGDRASEDRQLMREWLEAHGLS